MELLTNSITSLLYNIKLISDKDELSGDLNPVFAPVDGRARLRRSLYPPSSGVTASIFYEICCGSIRFHKSFQILLSLTSISLVSILAWAALALLALVVGSRLYVYIMVAIVIIIVIVIHLFIIIVILLLIHMIVFEGEPTGEAAERWERGSALCRL